MISSQGTTYRTSDESLVRVLERLRMEQVRIKAFYDGEYGKYGERHDFGYVQRTLGNPNYPNGGVRAAILVHNKRSMGGSILIDDHIVRIEQSNNGKLVWSRQES